MIDLENLFLREETRISPIKSDTNETRLEPNGQRAEFDRIFQDHLQAEEAAKSGKKAPLIPSADTVSEYRSLAGGAQLILGGAEPTDKSVASYAAAQGIDPEILSLLMPDPLNIAVARVGQHLKAETGLYLSGLSELLGEPTNIDKRIKGKMGVITSTLSGLTQSKAGGAQLTLSGSETTDKKAETGVIASTLSGLTQSKARGAQLTLSGSETTDKKAETGVIASTLSGLTQSKARGAQLTLSGAGTTDKKAETGVIASTLSGLTQSKAGGAQLTLSGAETTDKKAETGVIASTLSGLTQSKAGGAQLTLSGAEPTDKSIAIYAAPQGIDPEILSLLMPDRLNITVAHSGQHLKAETGLYLSALSELVGEPTNTDKLIKGEAGVAASTLSALVQNKMVQFSNETSIEKIQTLKQQFTVPRDSSKLKLDTIYLGRGAEDLISGIETKTNFHTGLGASRTESLLNMGQLSGVENRTDLANKSLVETITNKDESAALRRQEQFLETSRRLTQAIGERLTTQITKGAWSVEMELHPKSLGRIEIQLEMRNGELAAQFNPSQNVTRDLLQESFDKLKAILAEHGIDSAYIGLGNGEKQSFDGKPTGDELAPEERKDDNIDEMQVPKIVVSDRIGSDGLDVQV